MILPDINLLLFAYNAASPHHRASRAWWESATNGEELIGLPHEVLFGFVRIATNPVLGPAAVPRATARKTVSSWIALPNSRILLPQSDHFEKVLTLMEETNSVGRVLSDAVLAAHAITNRATLCSNDSDFARFRELDWFDPLAES